MNPKYLLQVALRNAYFNKKALNILILMYSFETGICNVNYYY